MCTLLLNGGGQTRLGPEGTSKLHEQVAQMPTPAILPSLSPPVPMASGGAPMISCQKMRKRGPGVRIVLPDMKVPPGNGQI